MITTRESINYQFSLIFGYSSPNDVVVGDVIGPGNLTKEKVNNLSQEVIQYLRMYNAVLRDYSGSEVFSIEFELFNFDEKSAKVNIYPKSMIFIPGNYKECESLILALKPETGYLDAHISKASLDNVSRLFFEVEEFVDRPELTSEEKQQVYNKFATRFSKNLFGELIEDKWNRKLIGLSPALPTEKDSLTSYGKVKSDVEINWNKRPHEISFLNPKFENIKYPLEGKFAVEHLKYNISEPSANFIVEKTLKLGTNLINLANTGTIDESQERIILYIIEYFKRKLNPIKDLHSVKWLISYTDTLLINLERDLNKFIEYSNAFLISGEVGDLSLIIEKYKQYIENKFRYEDEDYSKIFNLALNLINQAIVKRENVRAIELSSVFNYFLETIKKTLTIARLSLPKYLTRRQFKELVNELTFRVNQKFESEQKPAKNLGHQLVKKFKFFLLSQIEIHPMILSREPIFNEENIIKEFKKLVNINIEPFFDNIKLNISELVSFAEVQLDKNLKVFNEYIEQFKEFSNELKYLLSYMLRYSTINRFLKEEPNKEIADPVTFSNRFYRFLEKRLGGINLIWKSYVLDWINDYAKKFFKIEEKKEWTLEETYYNFIRYIEEREAEEQTLEHFLHFLDIYIAQVKDIEVRAYLLEFYKHFEYCRDISIEFPKYIASKIKTEIKAIPIREKEEAPMNFLNLDSAESFYEYIKETELKYFSKLIPRPKTLILKHDLTNEEKELFKDDLYHVINFMFWHSYARFELTDNFREVYREWMKEL